MALPLLFKEYILINDHFVIRKNAKIEEVLKNTLKDIKIIIAGGGTGGHIYPGLALAYDLLEQNPHWQVHFVGTRHGLESRIIPQTIPLHFLPIIGWQGSHLWHKIKIGLLLPFAFLKSIYLLLRIRPQYVLGMGGYASGPLILMASLMGFYTVIWEMNAYPGVTNRILARFVKECWIIFESASSHLKSQKPCKKTNIPIRKEIEDIPHSLHQKKSSKHHLLIFGGSHGAQGINRCVLSWIKQKPQNFEDYHIRFQTGLLNYDEIARELHGISNVQVSSYLNKIEEDYKWADVIICRAGASTIAELAATQKAAILVPFPFASEDHQRKNAQVLYDQKACVMILEKDLSPEKLETELLKIIKNQKYKQSLEQNISKWHLPGGRKKMLQHIVLHLKNITQ